MEIHVTIFKGIRPRAEECLIVSRIIIASQDVRTSKAIRFHAEETFLLWRLSFFFRPLFMGKNRNNAWPRHRKKNCPHKHVDVLPLLTIPKDAVNMVFIITGVLRINLNGSA